MKRITFAALAVAMSCAFAPVVHAEDGKYPQSVMGEGVSVKTRAQVIAEMSEPAAAEVSTAKTRAQVIAETREAARLGLLPGEREREATAEQERLIRLAGERAVESQTVAKH